MYTVYLNSKDWTFPHFSEIGYDPKIENDIRYENGGLVLGICDDVRYDTLIKKDGEPIGALSSDEPYYFYRTKIILDELGERV